MNRQTLASHRFQNKPDQERFDAKENLRAARERWGQLDRSLEGALVELSEAFLFSVARGDLLLIDGHWYVTNTGLLGLARRMNCNGIEVEAVAELCRPESSQWAFRAVVYKSHECRGFSGYGDADPTNVSALVRGAELRVAETRAVNRALRKAYGIGLCSVEELGMRTPEASRARPERVVSGPAPRKRVAAADGERRVRDRLLQLIRRHQLDPTLVKRHAIASCGTAALKDAKREDVEAFISNLAHQAATDREGLLQTLAGYAHVEEAA